MVFVKRLNIHIQLLQVHKNLTRVNESYRMQMKLKKCKPIKITVRKRENNSKIQ